MKLIKSLCFIGIASVLTINAFANEPPLTPDELKVKVEQILNKKKVLVINTPEEYIYNLDTTQFVKGLMYETSIVIKFLAENSNDPEKLEAFSKEFATNTQCFSIVVGNADNHFNTLYNLALPDQSMKDNYNKGYSYMVDRLEKYPVDPQYDVLCLKEKQKAIDYYNLHKDKKS